MNSIYFTKEHNLLREQIRRFIDHEVVPAGNDWEEAGMVPRDVLRRMGELGFFGIRYAEKYGGINDNALGSVILAEEVGRSSFGGFAATVLVHTDMASPHLNRYGSEAQLDAYMPAIVQGEKITAIAVTEPDAGSDVAGMKTTARRDGNEYVLNGSKMFITNGVHADLYFVAAKTDTEAKGSRGITMFIVEKGTPGFAPSRSLDKHGWRSSDTAELVFQDCRVPAKNILGNLHEGFYAIMRNFQNERLVLSAMSMGAAERAMRDAINGLNQGDQQGALGAQGEAVQQLQEAARSMAEQLAQQLGQQPGQGQGQGQNGQANQGGTDPLGRATRGRSSGGVQIPDISALQRARTIQDELRRRAGDRARPPVERDYLERLLERF